MSALFATLFSLPGDHATFNEAHLQIASMAEARPDRTVRQRIFPELLAVLRHWIRFTLVSGFKCLR